MAKYVDIGGELELVDLDVVADEVSADRSVLETIRREEMMFSSNEQINTRISLSEELVRYIRLISLVTSESEPTLKRGMIAYGKTYLYKHLYDNIKRMRECEILLVAENRFIRESVMSGIPCPVQFNERDNSGLRLASNVYGSLLFIADEMHLDRMYAVELAIWIALKDIFIQDNTVHNTLKSDKRFIENLRIYERLETSINDLCDDYEMFM